MSGAVSKAVLVTGCSSGIGRALRRRSPRPRYRVTAGARVILVTRAMTTDGGWDRVVRTASPPPRPE
ncbi:MAG TPA: hypothetical protein VHY55_02050 [Acidimicrobiia bacterium]|nr:hypothetical protein [Acidimicrobiia bacterium]